MAGWHQDEANQRIGDIIASFSPFFKMYTEYVKNFDSAINLINTMYHKNSKFAAIMDDIHVRRCYRRYSTAKVNGSFPQAMPECRSLSLQHHMLTPIQRIPRYVLLLKDYIKNLPEDSADKADSESEYRGHGLPLATRAINPDGEARVTHPIPKIHPRLMRPVIALSEALHLVSTAAAHANDAMKRIEKFKKLLEVQESLGGTVDLVSPTRELVKEGKMVKISARSGDHQDRYIFLVSRYINPARKLPAALFVYSRTTMCGPLAGCQDSPL